MKYNFISNNLKLVSYNFKIQIAREIPTSAYLKAGASLVESPNTATTCFLFCRNSTKLYLSCGVALARTLHC
jgi:hypothetical protein